MDIYTYDERDGARCSWNSWPPTKITSTRNVIPLGIIYSPLKQIDNLMLVEYDPVACPSCGGALNAHATVDFLGKVWICPFCMTRNRFPPQYAQHISETNLPPELKTNTIEYILPNQTVGAPIFIFIVDTCVYQEELDELKSALMQNINLLPADWMIGLITFGKNWYVYDLSAEDMTKMYAFRGDKAYTPEQVREQLGLVGHDPRGLRSGAKRFLMPIGECEFTLNAIFDELVRDSWPVKSGNRPQRCIGTSLATAIYLLEAAYPKQGARVMLFAGGAASYGPGQIVGVSLEETIRTAKDVKDENVKYMKAATNFYNQLAVKAILNGHAVDIFNCAIDQIGLMEMKNLPDKTGGYMLLTDSFGKDEFKSSLQKVFTTEASGALSMGFGANIDIFTSRDVKCSGCIGPVTSTKKKSAFVSDVEIGQGATSQWAMSSVDTYTTLAFYLDIVAQNRDPNRKKGVVQIHTRYQHASGRMRLRVTSLGYKYAETQSVAEYIPGFDQECAATIMARLSVFKSEQEELLDVIRWLDRTLIRLVSRFGDYQKDQPSTFRLCKEFTFYPQFIFHLRRSQFLQTFNVSPDESAYYRTLLARENIINSVVMIQPALLAYSVENPQPEPVQLDIISLKNNCILLLDTFFHVLIWHGDTIVKWRNDGYAENPEFEYFRDLLRYPQEDAADICALRFPVPKLSLCDTGQGAERFLKAKVNPSTNTASNAVSETGLYITDDVSLKVFMDHLVRLAVQS